MASIVKAFLQVFYTEAIPAPSRWTITTLAAGNLTLESRITQLDVVG
jgi:hypothetical protein